MKNLIEKWWVGIGSIGLGQIAMSMDGLNIALQIVAAVIGIMIGGFTLLEKYHAYKARKAQRKVEK